MANISQFGPDSWWHKISDDHQQELRDVNGDVLSAELAEAIHAAGGMTVKTNESGADWSTLRDEDWEWVRQHPADPQNQ